nr:putative ribonuclease H-like domain-containing protein [Tanacetum cinerariifolium]
MHRAFPLPVIEFPLPEEVPTASEENSYEVPANAVTTSTASDGTSKKKGRTVTVTDDDMQKRKNDATKKTKKNLLKLQYGNFKAEGSETLEQTFNRLQTWKKISIQGTDVTGFDKLKVECFNYHKMGHFTRECRAPRSQDRGRRDNYRQGFKVEEQALKALMGIDGVGCDWSYMANDEENHALVANEEAPTEFSLMAKTNAKSEVFDNSLCFKACKKNTNSLNSKITDLTDKLCDSKTMIYHYKLGLTQVEERLAELRNRELKYYETISALEFKVESSANCIESLTKDLELLKKEKGEIETKLTGFQTTSKDLDILLESQRLDKNKEGLGYCVDDIVTDYSRPLPAIESTLDDAQNRNPSVTEIEASPSTILPKPFIKFVKANNSPTKRKSKELEQFEIPSIRVKKGTTRSQNNNHKSFTPRPAIHKPYRPPVRPMRSNMNDALPNRTSFNKLAHSYTKRPFQRTSAVRSQYRTLWVPTVSRNFSTANRKFSTANRKFPTSSTKFSTADMGKRENAVKASASWIWKHRHNTANKGPNSNSVSVMFKKYTYIDTQVRLNGCSRHMTGNISYLSNYEPFDGGYVSFGQGGCKITSKGTIKIGKYFKLDDSNVLLRTPRQHNMYSIDLNNIVPHKDLTCLVAKAFADECILWHRRLEVDNSACYVQNRVLVNKSYNKTPYELFNGRTPAIGFLKPFGCHVMILNTLDNLAKFEAKGDEGYFIGYYMCSKAFRVFNKRTKRVEENLHVDLLENKAIEKGVGPNYLFDIDSLTKSMNYVPVVMQADQLEPLTVENPIPTVSSPVLTACFTDSQEPSSDTRLISKRVANQVETRSLDNILTLTNRFEDILRVTTNSNESNGVEADVSNMETTITASHTPTIRIHKDHPKSQIIGPVDTLIQTKNKSKEVGEHGFIATIHQKTDLALFQFCLFSCILYQVEPKKIYDALQEPSWVLKNKKDKRGIVIINKAKLVAQRHTHEERIDYDEVFAPVARIKAIKLLLAYASFIGFTVYQMDVKSAFFMLCREFEALMHEKFEMSFMGELNFFLGLDCFEKKLISVDHIHTDKKVADLLTKPFDAERFQYLVNVDFHPIVDFVEASYIRQYTRRARIAQSSALPPIANKHASPIGDVSQEMVLEIAELKARVKFLEDKKGGGITHSGDDAPIKRRRLDEGEAVAKRLSSDTEKIRLDKGEAAAERVSDDTEEMATVLTSMDAASMLSSGGVQVVSTAAAVATATISIPTGSGVVPTASQTIPTSAPIFATSTIVTPYTRQKGKEKMVESDTPKKKKLDAEIAKIHAEEELQKMIEGLDRINEIIAKHLNEYEEASAELSIKEKIELINELIKDFIPMGSKEEAIRFKRKGVRFEQDGAKKLNTLEEAPEKVKTPDEVLEEQVKEMMQLVPIEEHFNREDLNQLWALVKQSLNIRAASSDKEMELWVELKRLYEPNDEDQLWTHTQNLMYALVEWKLYDTCGVHHVTSKDREIFMLVEKDYPLRKGLAIVMISYKHQVEHYS